MAGAHSVRHSIKPGTILELHGSLPEHIQGFTLTMATGETASFQVAFRANPGGVTPELTPVFAAAPERLENKD